MEHIQISPLWRLHDELTVNEAAALLAGYDPSHVELCKKDTNFKSDFSDIAPAMSLLTNAINAGKLGATIRRDARMQGWDEWPNNGEKIRPLNLSEFSSSNICEPNVIYQEMPNWNKTSVSVDTLKAWLLSRGQRKGFFFPDGDSDSPDYLNQDHKRFAPKLAAAVLAWQAVTNPMGKSAKQALKKWLGEHAAELGLTDDEGKPNETGIEEVAKVANWQPGGGAAKTPGA